MTGMTRRAAGWYRRDRGAVGVELLAGLAAAVVGGFVWALVVYYTEREFLYLVIGIGAGVGAAVAATVKQANAGHGISAAGFAVLGLMLGKFLIVQWSLGSAVVNGVVNDPVQMGEAMLYQVATSEQADPQVRTWYLEETTTADEVPDELAAKIADTQVVANEVLADMDDDQKLAAARSYVQYATADLSHIDKIKMDMSGWDFLWFGIAVVVAYQIGSGGGKGGKDQAPSDEPQQDPA